VKRPGRRAADGSINRCRTGARGPRPLYHVGGKFYAAGTQERLNSTWGRYQVERADEHPAGRRDVNAPPLSARAEIATRGSHAHWRQVCVIVVFR
jgi:hypothetical protein